MSVPNLVYRAFDDHPEGDPPPCVESTSPLGLARAFVASDGWRLARLDRTWWRWDGTRYGPIDQEYVEAALWKWLDEQAAIDPTPSLVSKTLKALSAIRLLPNGTRMPTWLGLGVRPDPQGIIAFANGLLDTTRDEFRLLDHSPDWFSTHCIPNPYLPDADCPEWDRFLDQVFDGDAERKRCLQQWFGYNLTDDTRQQKFALLVGPPASGKSTTLRILGDMLGRENVATPTLTTLWRFYGMETIYRSKAALVGDAHLESAGKATAILDKLKSVVGGDPQNVDRKGRPELANLKVNARFTIAVNEMPQLPDSSDALRRRMLVIPFNRSFIGHEDLGLGTRLSAEMPGIVAWAIRGQIDLRRAGTLHQAPAGLAILDDFSRLSSPIKEFL